WSRSRRSSETPGFRMALRRRHDRVEGVDDGRHVLALGVADEADGARHDPHRLRDDLAEEGDLAVQGRSLDGHRLSRRFLGGKGWIDSRPMNSLRWSKRGGSALAIRKALGADGERGSRAMRSWTCARRAEPFLIPEVHG